MLLLALVGALAAEPAPADDTEISRAVVRLVNTGQRPDPLVPWNGGGIRKGTGTGFVIEGGRILTNAHVISDSRMLLLYFHDDPEPHEARVVVAGHDCDLAIVEPLDTTLLDDRTPLQLADALPALRSEVLTYGYPAGGERMSSTQGVVSRIEVNTYVHAPGWRHLTVQTDAAINPGNSGGPVLQDGKVVGVAFQTHLKLDDVGHFIPNSIVEHFLTDVEDGEYDGYGHLGLYISNLENPAARARKKVPDDRTGVVVDFVVPGSTSDGRVKPGDVLLSVDGVPLANDGTVELYGHRLALVSAVDRYQHGETAELELLRDGQLGTVTVTVGGSPSRDRHKPRWDTHPRYYVYAGLVFVPLDKGVLSALGSSAPSTLLHEAYMRPFEDDDFDKQESVILLERLEHPVNVELAWFRRKVVDRINGRPIRNLADVIAAFGEGDSEAHVLEYAHYGQLGVLDRAAAEAAHAEILEQYGLSTDRRL
jgi:S1-C subfamily serine protease